MTREDLCEGIGLTPLKIDLLKDRAQNAPHIKTKTNCYPSGAYFFQNELQDEAYIVSHSTLGTVLYS